MTHSELRHLADTDGVSIGAHTCTHPSLPLLKRDSLEREISASRQQCEEITGRRVAGFAYPFGDFDDSTAEAVRSAGMDYAVTTLPREAGLRVDPFRLPRVTVADWGERVPARGPLPWLTMHAENRASRQSSSCSMARDTSGKLLTAL